MIPATTCQPMPRVLVVDDDCVLRGEIAAYLSEHGLAVDTAQDAQEMDLVLAANTIDVVVLDVMLPGESGLSIARRLATPDDPSIVMLSAMGEDVDRIIGLEIGADDYLAKPCAPRELLARIRAVLRGRKQLSGSPRAAHASYSFCGFHLDLLRRQLQAPGGVLILLTTGEFSLLTAFLERPNRVLSRDELLDVARGNNADIFDRAIDVQVSRLRRKLNSCTDREIIRTLRGAGYMFDGPVSRP